MIIPKSTPAAEWFAEQSFHGLHGLKREPAPPPPRAIGAHREARRTIRRSADEKRERRAHVYAWLAYLCRVEAAKLAGLAPRSKRVPSDDELERAASTLEAARDLEDRAALLAGCITERERLDLFARAMERFTKPEPEQVQ